MPTSPFLPISRAWSLFLFIVSAPVLSTAAGVDIVADTITSDPYGVIIAEGDVVIKRKEETLKADRVDYDTDHKTVVARGNVIIESDTATLRAESAQMHTVDKTGTLHKTRIELNTGERITAEKAVRQSESVLTADDVTFTTCPPDSETWSIRAASAELNQEAGTITARHGRFEIGDIPVFYTPYWQQPLRRKSGVLLPFVATGKVRGTETALPLYLAPADNWDMTLTPHWMTARGMMGEAEFRYASPTGYTKLYAEGIRDKKTSTQRSRLKADIDETLPFDIRFSAQADHLNDRFYLADFGTNSDTTSSRYLQSNASLFQSFDLAEWNLLVSHRQNLQTESNIQTLQILPRFESGIHLPLFDNRAVFHIEQQSTQFDRTVGIHGTRVDLNPWLEIPLQFAGGGITSTIAAGYRHTRYWLKGLNPPDNTIPTRNTFETSIENRIEFERISAARKWRHTITPVLRYDYIDAPDQSGLPNFDSSFGKLSISNLLNGNRFTGRDRIERLSRISALIETGLQHKDSGEITAHTYIRLRVGAAYDLIRKTVDPALLTAPTHPFSNLLGEITLAPTDDIKLSAGGQYDPIQKFLATANAGLTVTSKSGHKLNLNWRMTDARYATASEYAMAMANLQLTRRTALSGSWQYDLLLKQTQQASGGLKYVHPCWDASIEAYRYRLNGTDVTNDIGVRFLIGFKGLGSVGSS